MDWNIFFRELKRRNVYKVAAAYAVVAWLIIQIATQVFPFFEIPNWAVRLVVLLLILGFPVVLILAWAFEITPEGIKRESEVEPEKSTAVRRGRKIVGLTIALGIIAAGLLAWQLFHPLGATRRAVQSANTNKEPGSAAALPVSDKSIAVLPFENLSSDKENAYFAEGIQDEILTRLSKIAALKVISRTSTEKYRSAPENLRQVGEELGVANLLEGSVQKIANAVHVNVQLIRAATGEHVWAESYNRKLDDVFGVEGEVAGNIAQQLNAKLTGTEQRAVAEKPTQNAAAYDAYLRGISLENAGESAATFESFRQATAAYAEAVRLDPKFALAWARLALARSYLYFNSIDLATNSGAAVRQAADRALALQPESGEAWVAQGVYRYRVLRDFPGALQAYQEALKRLPNSSLVLEQMGHVERRLGRVEDAATHYEAAAQLDPRNFGTLFALAGIFRSQRRFAKAETVLDRVLKISPSDEGALAREAQLFQGEGRLKEAAEALAKVPVNSNDITVAIARSFQLFYERRFEAAAVYIQQESPALAGELSALRNTLLGYCQLFAGRKDDARATFARVVASIKPSPTSVVPVNGQMLPSLLALAHAGLGDKEKALAEARRAVAVYKGDALAKPFAEQVLAIIQASFGDLDSAIAALPHLLEVPAGVTKGDLRVDPFWDPLRKDPRFAKLIVEPQPK